MSGDTKSHLHDEEPPLSIYLFEHSG